MLKNAKNAYFSHHFCHFWPTKKNLFSKIRLHGTHDTIKSYLDTKNQKNMEPFLWNTSRRTDGRTDKSKSIGPPKFLGSVQKTNNNLEYSGKKPSNEWGHRE